MYSHAAIVRFHYDQEDPRVAWRFSYFRDQVLPRLLAQTAGCFDIAVRCNAWAAPMFEALSPRIRTFTVRNERVLYKGAGKRYFYDFARWDEVEGLGQYDIQSGIDSDDLLAPDYMELTLEAIAAHVREHGRRSLHISFQPALLDVATGKERPIGQTYGPTMGSAFFSIFQPRKDQYRFAYEISHLKLYTLFDRSITLPAGHCWASVHQHNESTGKTH